MTNTLATLDWLIIGLYLIGLVGWAIWLSRSQSNRDDYYVGGRDLNTTSVAISVMATQCSTNSILGAPAFVAFTAGGGLLWLQYELAVPLAMAALIIFVMPVFRKLNLISVYAYLENRFDLKTRLVMSGIFLFIRAFATAVTVYGIGLVIDLITGIGFFWSVMLLALFTIVYDFFGGMRGVVYSDVLQLIILVVVLLLLLFMLSDDAGGFLAMFQQFPDERANPIDFAHHGIGDGHTYAFWPMVIGGFFLYMAYYGCDQSQAQRALSTRSVATTNQVMFINGLARFPLVLLYCLVGVGIGVFALNEPSFITALPETANGTPQLNLAVPWYMIQALPTGIVGLGLVALFAAAMSSLDSVINSLSATTMEDFVVRFSKQDFSQRKELWLSRLFTAFWGIMTLVLAFYVEDIAPTVLEAINKIGSLANGSILAVFMLGILTRSATANGVIAGLIAGAFVNALLWQFAPLVSWLWWNVTGLITTVMIAFLMREKQPIQDKRELVVMQRINSISQQGKRMVVILFGYFLLLCGLLIWL